jgi:hypothetical protein
MIRFFADHMMKAIGYPEDRRRHVEADVRKLARIEVAQWEYCRHLQPLQNLIHTQSPATAFSRPTMYVCSCTLFGHQTKIEVEDVDVTISAMKQVYCSKCSMRSPLSSDQKEPPSR